MAHATAYADITLVPPSGSYNWEFDFRNFVAGEKGNVSGYDYYPELTQTFRLADAGSHFTSFTIDLNAVADIWFTNYYGVGTTLPIPDDFTAGIAASLFINGVYIDSLSYGTGDSLVFDPNYIYFDGIGEVRQWDPTGEAPLQRYFDIDLSQFGETNELTLVWRVSYGEFTSIFAEAEDPNGYCPSAWWDINGAFDVTYTSEGNANAPTPEPATMLIFGLGLAAAPFARRLRNRK